MKFSFSVRKSIFLAVAGGAVSLYISTAAEAATTGNWIGPSGGAWSISSNWLDDIIPDGQGDIAQYTTAGSSSRAVNVEASVTVGTLQVLGTTNHSMQFTPDEVIVMDQDGAGPDRTSGSTTSSRPPVPVIRPSS